MLVALTPATRIFVAVAPVDLRRSFDGLSAHVQEVLCQSVIEGGLFVFTNRRRNRVRLLWWDGSGLWVATNMHAPQCAVIKGRKSSLSLSSFVR